MENRYMEKYALTMHKLMRIGRLHRVVFERNISNMGIHHSQHHLLMYLAKEGEVGSQKEIAEKLGVSSAAVARLLKGLEAEGFIEKCSIENDGRYNKISITEKGKDIVHRSHVLFKETDMSVFRDFSDDELILFNELLDKMQSGLLEKIDKNELCCCVRSRNEEK